jgi:hypothetical protein
VSYRSGWVYLELDKPANGIERVAKQETGPIDRPKKVADDRKGRTFDLPEQHRWSAGLANPPLDGPNLEMRVNLLVDDNELTGCLQVSYALRERSISHWPSPR